MVYTSIDTCATLLGTFVTIADDTSNVPLTIDFVHQRTARVALTGILGILVIASTDLLVVVIFVNVFTSVHDGDISLLKQIR